MHIGQPEISTGMTIRQPFVVEAQAVQNCCVKVEKPHGILDDFAGVLVRCVVNDAPLDAAAL